MIAAGIRRRFVRGLLVILAATMAACASNPPAPVVDRSEVQAAEVPVDGLYRMHRGDTLHGIAFKYGLDWRSIARWNAIGSPYTIYPDQVLRLTEPPPRSTASSTVQTRAVPTQRATTRTVTPPPPTRATTAAPATSSPSTTASTAPATVNAASKAPEPAASAPPRPAPAAQKPPLAAPSDWIWPSDGRLLRTFKAGDPSRNGLDITAQAGSPVKATAAGDVVYSGNGLIGYGELVIIKHSDRMLSAYAHNRRRLVAEGDRVSQGQVIAEVGTNDRRETLLHFEIRRDGKPVDPMGYLPKR